MSRIQCYTCNSVSSLRSTGSGSELRCPICDSEFVEQLPTLDTSTRNTSRTRGHGDVEVHISTHAVPVPFGMNPLGGMPMANMAGPSGTQALMFSMPFDAAMNGGLGGILSGLMLPGDGGMPGTPMGGESFDHLLTRILNSYQPPAQPTASVIRESLPRLKVRPAKDQYMQGSSSSVELSTSSGSVPQADAKAEKAGDGSVITQQAQSDINRKLGFASCCEGEPCSVCHDAFVGGEEVLELPCQHCFHEACVMPWLDEHNTCPVCRYKLAQEEDLLGSAASASGSRHGPTTQHHNHSHHHHHHGHGHGSNSRRLSASSRARAYDYGIPHRPSPAQVPGNLASFATAPYTAGDVANRNNSLEHLANMAQAFGRTSYSGWPQPTTAHQRVAGPGGSSVESASLAATAAAAADTSTSAAATAGQQPPGSGSSCAVTGVPAEDLRQSQGHEEAQQAQHGSEREGGCVSTHPGSAEVHHHAAPDAGTSREHTTSVTAAAISAAASRMAQVTATAHGASRNSSRRPRGFRVAPSTRGRVTTTGIPSNITPAFALRGFHYDGDHWDNWGGYNDDDDDDEFYTSEEDGTDENETGSDDDDASMMPGNALLSMLPDAVQSATSSTRAVAGRNHRVRRSMDDNSHVNTTSNISGTRRTGPMSATIMSTTIMTGPGMAPTVVSPPTVVHNVPININVPLNAASTGTQQRRSHAAAGGIAASNTRSFEQQQGRSGDGSRATGTTAGQYGAASGAAPSATQVHGAPGIAAAVAGLPDISRYMMTPQIALTSRPVRRQIMMRPSRGSTGANPGHAASTAPPGSTAVRMDASYDADLSPFDAINDMMYPYGLPGGLNHPFGTYPGQTITVFSTVSPPGLSLTSRAHTPYLSPVAVATPGHTATATATAMGTTGATRSTRQTVNLGAPNTSNTIPYGASTMPHTASGRRSMESGGYTTATAAGTSAARPPRAPSTTTTATASAVATAAPAPATAAAPSTATSAASAGPDSAAAAATATASQPDAAATGNTSGRSKGTSGAATGDRPSTTRHTTTSTHTTTNSTRAAAAAAGGGGTGVPGATRVEGSAGMTITIADDVAESEIGSMIAKQALRGAMTGGGPGSRTGPVGSTGQAGNATSSSARQSSGSVAGAAAAPSTATTTASTAASGSLMRGFLRSGLGLDERPASPPTSAGNTPGSSLARGFLSGGKGNRSSGGASSPVQASSNNTNMIAAMPAAAGAGAAGADKRDGSSGSSHPATTASKQSSAIGTSLSSLGSKTSSGAVGGTSAAAGGAKVRLSDIDSFMGNMFSEVSKKALHSRPAVPVGSAAFDRPSSGTATPVTATPIPSSLATNSTSSSTKDGKRNTTDKKSDDADSSATKGETAAAAGGAEASTAQGATDTVVVGGVDTDNASSLTEMTVNSSQPAPPAAAAAATAAVGGLEPTIHPTASSSSSSVTQDMKAGELPAVLAAESTAHESIVRDGPTTAARAATHAQPSPASQADNQGNDHSTDVDDQDVKGGQQEAVVQEGVTASTTTQHTAAAPAAATPPRPTAAASGGVHTTGGNSNSPGGRSVKTAVVASNAPAHGARLRVHDASKARRLNIAPGNATAAGPRSPVRTSSSGVGAAAAAADTKGQAVRRASSTGGSTSSTDRVGSGGGSGVVGAVTAPVRWLLGGVAAAVRRGGSGNTNNDANSTSPAQVSQE